MLLIVYCWALGFFPGRGKRDGKNSEELRAVWEKSQQALLAGNLEVAEETSRILIKAIPGSAQYLFHFASVLQKRGKFLEEAEALEKFMVAAPIPEEGCPALGIAYEKAGDIKGSFQAHEKCYKLSPRTFDFIFYFARAKEQSGDFEGAQALYRKGLQRAPEYTDISLGLARTFFFQRELAQAEKIVAKVLRKNSNNADALVLHAQLLRARGSLQEAMKVLKRGIALSPKYVEMQRLLSSIEKETSERK